MHKFITFDIETYVEVINGDKRMVPYAIAFYDGVQHKSYYVTNYSSHSDMIASAFKDYFIPKYRGFSFYAHNLGSFDGIFTLDVLLTNFGGAKISPIIKGGKIIYYSVKFNGMIFHFKDSLELIPASLSKICAQFGIKDGKGVFPHTFVTRDRLEYFGPKPPMEAYSEISREEYDLIPNE